MTFKEAQELYNAKKEALPRNARSCFMVMLPNCPWYWRPAYAANLYDNTGKSKPWCRDDCDFPSQSLAKTEMATKIADTETSWRLYLDLMEPTDVSDMTVEQIKALL